MKPIDRVHTLLANAFEAERSVKVTRAPGPGNDVYVHVDRQICRRDNVAWKALVTICLKEGVTPCKPVCGIWGKPQRGPARFVGDVGDAAEFGEAKDAAREAVLRYCPSAAGQLAMHQASATAAKP